MSSSLNSLLSDRLAKLDLKRIQQDFRTQDEFIVLDDFLPPETLETLLARLPTLESCVHRNFIPKHKKGGSVSRFDLDRAAPEFSNLYNTPALLQFLSELSAQNLQICPNEDPHTYALYYYTRAGDHIGYHYDTSYYQGARYTVLIGLVPAPSCRLEYQLHSKNPDQATETGQIELEPGALVLFNGDKLYHRITPIAPNERRVALTMEYLTSRKMNPLLRFVSNMKDAIAYFGFRQVFGGGATKHQYQETPD